MDKETHTAKELLKVAKSAPSKAPLTEHLDTILTLRNKSYSWRDIAVFLNEHGVETDHSKIFRFINKQRKNKMDPYEKYFVPTSSQYLAALKDIDKDITPKQKEMLGFHFKAHNRTATFGELAEAVGYSSPSTANSKYGTLGRMLGENLKMIFIPMDEGRSDVKFYSSSIGTGNPYARQDNLYQLVMHHELAKALDELSWFE